MRAASLTAALILAKVLGLANRDLPSSVWLPPALFWDDVALGCAFWLFDRWSGRHRALWVLYWGIVVWAAVNVPIVRAVSSALTVPMLRAAGGPLRDSIAHYLTWGNAALMATVTGVAATMPAIVRHIRPRRRVVLALATIGIAAAGPLVTSRLDLRGLERNAVTTLVTTSIPRVAARSATGDWRASPFEAKGGLDLTAWRGAASGYNVVLIVLESTAAQYLRPYGAADDPMPNLTRLASRAFQFEHAYAVYPESIKGLFATLCSRAPAFDVPAEAHARASCVPLAERFRKAGYRTALFHSGRFAYLGMDAIVARQEFDTLEDAGAISGKVQSSFGVDEGSTVDRILSWVEIRDRRPFFITYLPAAGHHPYATAAPGPFHGEGELNDYKNALHDGDRSLGVLIDALGVRGLDRQTLIAVIGDHGEGFGQHDGNYGHTFALYEENVHVPLVIKLPSSTSHASVPTAASAIDIAPTLLDLVGLPVPPEYEGESLLTARSRMAMFFTDYSVGLLGLRDACWKYQFAIESHRSRLFDVCLDPGERLDRSNDKPERLAAYRDRLEQWSSAARDRIVNGR